MDPNNSVIMRLWCIWTPQSLTIPFSKIWTSKIYYPMLCLKIAGWVANSIDTDEMPYSAASHLGLQCLLRPVCLFVCVEVLWPSQPNGVMSSAVSLPNHMFTGQALSSKRLTSIVHILSPETDNCPSWISGRERMTVENISWSISTKECCWPWRG